MTHIKVKDYENFVRDPATGAILNTDQSILIRVNAQREATEKQVAQENKINSIEKDLAEIKDLLNKLVY